VQRFTANGDDRRMQPVPQERQHLNARLAIVFAGVFLGNGRLLVEFRHPLERQAAFRDVPGILCRIERQPHTGLTL
jgi:hypothetical protein